eukprot:1125495-Pyramimonas_sp.AAC.1
MVSLARTWTGSATQCQGCLTLFDQTHHLTEHLAIASPACLVATIDAGEAPGAEECETRKELPRGLLRKRANIPAIKAAEPMPDVVSLSQDDAKAVLL